MNTTAASSDRSPPSSAAMSQSQSQSASSASNPHPFPTPASTTGVISGTNHDSDDVSMMDDGTEDDALRIQQHRQSNHNRQPRLEFSERGGLKAAEGIIGDQLFRVAQSMCQIAKPHPSQNLFDLYSLNKLAGSVARTNPETGEKINKLRKSYEGHIKQLQIAGKPKAVKMERVFSNLVLFPEEEWNAQQGGKEPWRALSGDGAALNADFSSLLDQAFEGMAPGTLPSGDANRYKTYIGTDDAIRPKPQDGPAHRATPMASAAPTPGNSAANRGASRPERPGAKRQYTDAAFQGYGEGYGDDFGADSTGGEDNAGGNKRRKIQFENTSRSVEVGGARR